MWLLCRSENMLQLIVGVNYTQKTFFLWNYLFFLWNIIPVHVENHTTQKINLRLKSKSNTRVLWQINCLNFLNQTSLGDLHRDWLGTLQIVAKWDFLTHAVSWDGWCEPQLWNVVWWQTGHYQNSPQTLDMRVEGTGHELLMSKHSLVLNSWQIHPCHSQLPKAAQGSRDL